MSEEASFEKLGDTSFDGIDRCRWLACYVPANGAGAPLCTHHKKAPGARLVVEALRAAERMYVFAKTEDEMRTLAHKTEWNQNHEKS